MCIVELYVDFDHFGQQIDILCQYMFSNHLQTNRRWRCRLGGLKKFKVLPLAEKLHEKDVQTHVLRQPLRCSKLYSTLIFHKATNYYYKPKVLPGEFSNHESPVR